MQFSSCFFTSQDRSKIKWCLLFCFPRMMAVLLAGCSSFSFLTRHQTRNNINIELKGRCQKYLASGNFHPSPLRNTMSCSYFRLTFWKKATLADICRQTPMALSRMLQDLWGLAKRVQTKGNIAPVRTSLSLHVGTYIISDLRRIHVPCGSSWIYVFDMLSSISSASCCHAGTASASQVEKLGKHTAQCITDATSRLEAAWNLSTLWLYMLCHMSCSALNMILNLPGLWKQCPQLGWVSAGVRDTLGLSKTWSLTLSLWGSGSLTALSSIKMPVLKCPQAFTGTETRKKTHFPWWPSKSGAPPSAKLKQLVLSVGIACLLAF